MTAREALENGQLEDALTIQTEIFDRDPVNPAARLLLAELLILAGRLVEARTHFRYLNSDAPHWPQVRRGFIQLLKAVHRRGHRPTILTDIVPRHVRRRWKAAQAIRVGDSEAAAVQIDGADNVSPAINGHVDGREFMGLRDADDRFASLLELFVGGKYCWLPFESLKRVTLAQPESVLDVAYRPARVHFVDGTVVRGVLPLVYPDSHADDGEFAIGLDTDWKDAGGLAVGVGAKLILAGDEELRLGDCRQLEFLPST